MRVMVKMPAVFRALLCDSEDNGWTHTSMRCVMWHLFNSAWHGTSCTHPAYKKAHFPQRIDLGKKSTVYVLKDTQPSKMHFRTWLSWSGREYKKIKYIWETDSSGCLKGLPFPVSLLNISNYSDYSSDMLIRYFSFYAWIINSQLGLCCMLEFNPRIGGDVNWTWNVNDCTESGM